MRESSEVPTPQALPPRERGEQPVNNQCMPCRELLTHHSHADYSPLVDALINRRCKHAKVCTEIVTCPGCGLPFMRCQHCLPALCIQCAHVQHLHDAEAACRTVLSHLDEPDAA